MLNYLASIKSCELRGTIEMQIIILLWDTITRIGNKNGLFAGAAAPLAVGADHAAVSDTHNI